jgi:hypothetical protein
MRKIARQLVIFALMGFLSALTFSSIWLYHIRSVTEQMNIDVLTGKTSPCPQIVCGGDGSGLIHVLSYQEIFISSMVLGFWGLIAACGIWCLYRLIKFALIG